MFNINLFALKKSFKLMARKSARSHFHVYTSGLQLPTAQNLNDNLGALISTHQWLDRKLDFFDKTKFIILKEILKLHNQNNINALENKKGLKLIKI